MSELDKVIDQIESHAALYREQRLRAEIERLTAITKEQGLQVARQAAEIERLRSEGRRFMQICGEGSARGRAIDLIPKPDWERFRRALEGAGAKS